MQNRFFLFAAGLAAAGLLLSGCRSAPSGAGRQNGASAADGRPQTKAGAQDEKSLAKRARAHAHYAAGVVHDLNGETEPALDEYFKAALDDPDDETLILDVTRSFIEDKKPERALELLQIVAARPGATGAIFARLGFVYSLLGKSEKAIEANRTAIRKSPRLLAGYRNLFEGYLEKKQPDNALGVLDEAVKVSKADPEFFISLSELYARFALQFPTRREKVNAKGLAALGRVDALKLSSVPLRLKLADQFNALGDEKKAAELYRELLKRLADAPGLRDTIQEKLADFYLRINDPKRAAEQLEAIVRSDPSNAWAYYCLGRIASREERWADAVEQFRKALLFGPGLEPAYYDLAGAQIALGQAADALVTLDKARNRFPQGFALEYLYGMAYGRQKDYAEAVRHFTTAEVVAQATAPDLLTDAFYFQAGAAFERKGDYTAAENYFERCIKLNPGFADALNYLGYMWAERGTNLDQARGLIERALKVEPKNAAFLDSMGWVLFKLNQPKEALGYILKAVELNGVPDATLLDHLGDVYAAVNEIEKAREAWRKSLAIEANEQIRKKLGDAR